MRSNTILRTTSLISLILVSSFLSDLFSQVLEPSFKQIELLTYDLNSPRTKINDQIVIQTYVKINEIGKMFVIESNEAQQPKYYSYQLSNAEIDILNSVFNGQKKLNKLIKNQKLDGNVFYAGYYKFLKFIYLNNKSDKISFIESDNIDDIEEALAIIISKSSSYNNNQIEKETEFEINSLFIEEAFQSHRKFKKLPEINLPPPPGN